jgi:prevent-host-death family protein
MQKRKTIRGRGRSQKTTPKGPWQLQVAKARFNELFRRALSEGPQLITRQGKEGVVMISDEQYERLVGEAHQPKTYCNSSGNHRLSASTSTWNGIRMRGETSSYDWLLTRYELHFRVGPP